MAVNPEHAFRDGFGPPGGPSAVVSIEAALREKLEARGVSGERAFRLLFDLENRGVVDRDALARALHRFNIPASEAEVDALVARYDSTGARGILVSDFCERLLAPDFPTAAEKARRLDTQLDPERKTPVMSPPTLPSSMSQSNITDASNNDAAR